MLCRNEAVFGNRELQANQIGRKSYQKVLESQAANRSRKMRAKKPSRSQACFGALTNFEAQIVPFEIVSLSVG
jgi:hypothetical protein